MGRRLQMRNRFAKGNTLGKRNAGKNHWNYQHGFCARAKASPEHKSWDTMIQRCTNPNAYKWPLYGGKGVLVCKRWRTFTNFLADMGRRPQGTTLGRFKDHGDYKPSNCAWMTRAQQEHHRRLKREALGGQSWQPQALS
jgi:hypothetical protein